MIDIITPKSLKKSSKKKGTKVLDKTVQDDDFQLENVKPTPAKRRKKKDSDAEPQSTVPDESFMLPSDIEFIKLDKSLEGPPEETIVPSDPDDPDYNLPLCDLIACRSTTPAPESSLKCVWSHKPKIMKRNRSICICYSELECQTLEKIKSIKILRSKRKFAQHFAEFEKSATDIQCEYPYCKRASPTAPSLTVSKLKTTSKLVKKSKKHKVCSKASTEQLVIGSKRGREEKAVKPAKYSKYFINEVVLLMLDNKAVWSTEIIIKLIKTKQLSSRSVRDVGLSLIKSRDVPTLQLLVEHTRTCSEKHVVAMLSEILKHPVYTAPSPVDGGEKQTLDLALCQLLSLPFEGRAMKHALKPFPPPFARALLKILTEQTLLSAPVLSKPLNLAQVVSWMEILVEVYFAIFLQETELITQIRNTINLHLQGSRQLFGLNEHLFRIKHSKKFRK